MRLKEWVWAGVTVALAASCAASIPEPAAPTKAPASPMGAAAPPAGQGAPPTPAKSTAVAASLGTSPAPTPTREEADGDVTITILYDNNEHDDRLETDWGFSCLVEGLEKTILFDTGGDSGLLLRNARALGIAPHDVDAVVISHVHGDHVGGLLGFLDENHEVTVYLPESFPDSIEAAAAESGARIVGVHEPVEICEWVLSTGELGDQIKEQSLIIETARGTVVITGCAHPGVVDIVARAKELTGGKVYLVLGGFHLVSVGEARIAGVVADLQQLGVERVAPCHCSGDVARSLFRNAYGEDFISAGVGSILEIRR
jgi:7,8-dihydropterin-6-yl-methyl-4-(beta-D-ribofuranosyl)aminobenzene 5'-phosphate synthase